MKIAGKELLFALFPRKALETALLFAAILLGNSFFFAFADRENLTAAAALLEFRFDVLYLLLFILFVSIGPPRLNAISGWFFITVLTLWSTLDIFLFLHFHARLEPVFLDLAFLSGPNERAGFFPEYVWNVRNLIFVFLAAGTFGIFFGVKKIKFRIIALAASAALLPPALVAAFRIEPSAEPDKNTLCQLPARLDDYLEYLVFHRHIAESVANANADLAVRPGKVCRTVILVIGESHSKAHSSLYGYPRKNNPRLEKLAAENRLFVFSDAVASHSFTEFSVPNILTLASHRNGREFYQMPDIFDLARAAGFRTWWLCGQEPAFDGSVSYSAVTRRADRILYGNVHEGRRLDGSLLALLRQALADPAENKLIVCQLNGSHFHYENTYPPEFARYPPDAEEDFFTPSQRKNRKKVNAYDNSILYNDTVLAEMMKLLEESGQRGFLFYVPDHGENLYETPGSRMHSEFKPTRSTAEVPAYLYLSGSFRAAMPEEVRERLAKAVKLPFATEDVIYLLFDLAGMEWTGSGAPESILSPAFRPVERRVSRAGTLYESLPEVPRPREKSSAAR